MKGNKWAPDCEFWTRSNCRSPVGCHCREIAALKQRIAELEAQLGTLRANVLQAVRSSQDRQRAAL